MKVTSKLIKELNPCEGRFNNYLNFYSKKEYSKAQFLGLKNITHEDKLWVALRLMPRKNIKLAASDIAELVLHIFEVKYPGDNRPRKAIETARNGSPDAYNAADSAAEAANASYAVDHAASAAASAAVYAANASYAVDHAAYDIYAVYVARAATYAADAADLAATTNKKIRTIVLKYWK